MNLILNNFRCHRKAEFKFQTNSLILIKGDSGAGKTSLLLAIEHCLYAPRAVEALPKGEKANRNLQCSVELKFSNGLTVYREKSPNTRLVVIAPGVGQLIDVPAQAYIESLFGSHEIWLATTYVSQKSFNYMLEATNAEKLALLNCLAFQQEDPEKKIKQIEARFNQESSELKTMEIAYNQELAIFNRDIQNVNPQTSWGITEEQYKSIQAELQALQQAYPQLYASFNEANQIKGQIRYIESEVADLTQRITPLGPIDLVTKAKRLAELHQLRKEYLDFNQLWIQSDMLKQSILDIQSPPVKLEDITAVQLVESKVASRLNVCQRYRLSSKQEIEERIRLLDSALQAWPTQRLIARKLQLKNMTTPDEVEDQESKIKQLESERAKLDPDLQALQAKLYTIDVELRDLQTLLSCPACAAPLRMQQGKLHSTGLSPKSSAELDKQRAALMEEIKSLNKQKADLAVLITQSYQKQTLFTEYKLRQKELESLAHLPETLQQLPQIDQTELSELRNMLASWCEPPLVSSHKLQQALENQRRQQELRRLDETLANRQRISQEDYDKIQVEIGQIESEKKKYEEQEFIATQLSQKRTFLQTLKDKCPSTTESDLKANQDKQISLNTILTNHNLYATFCQRSGQLNQQRQALMEKQSKVTIYAKLKAKAVEIEHQMLELITENINSVMADMLSNVFEEPIQASLSTIRELKTGGQKFQVNLKITHDGCPKDFKKDLSGGEKDRVSLALTLALYSASSFPLLMLDECMDSLGATLKDTCLKQIRKFTKGKSALVIDIGHIEGLYDDCIHIKK